ncbi:helix-turn-helix domain-containing protein [Spirosoma panaciterrae]|uniref:helix-turn-helix domain-containing protein n=1 Tax=Spirosoma panaciterrae TaxID=496058 RepID=UPI000372FF78|nr:helix-turn-helix domain-containing protein [Spirosoma panaciterrae]
MTIAENHLKIWVDQTLRPVLREMLRDELADILSSLKVQPTSVDEETILTVSQAADFLGITPQTVYQRIKDLPHKKRFGRLYFLKSELVAYLQAGTQNQEMI